MFMIQRTAGHHYVRIIEGIGRTCLHVRGENLTRLTTQMAAQRDKEISGAQAARAAEPIMV
jgi:hypothetical protein